MRPDTTGQATEPVMQANLPECVEIAADGEHRWSVIWLHGLGADGHDFEPIAGELHLPADHGVRFVFPHAPERPVTLNAGMRMRAWYDLTGAEFSARDDSEGIRASAALIEALIARERARGIGAERIVLAGFSQGGALALHTGLRHPQRLAGIVALSAYLPLADGLEAELAGANRLTPVFQAHGEQDTVVPLDLAAWSYRRLAAVRPAPEWRTYRMDHGVCAEEIADLRRWLLEQAGLRGTT